MTASLYTFLRGATGFTFAVIGISFLVEPKKACPQGVWRVLSGTGNDFPPELPGRILDHATGFG